MHLKLTSTQLGVHRLKSFLLYDAQEPRKTHLMLGDHRLRAYNFLSENSTPECSPPELHSRKIIFHFLRRKILRLQSSLSEYSSLRNIRWKILRLEMFSSKNSLRENSQGKFHSSAIIVRTLENYFRREFS
jgi:hypothetical protein